MEIYLKVKHINNLVSDKTLKALIYYLKVPKDKQGQEKRFREVIASKQSYSVSNL